MENELVGVVGFVLLLVLLALRVPVGIAMIAISVGGYAYIISPSSALARLGSDAFGGASAYSLSIIPLFVLMGLLLAQAHFGRDVYRLLDALLWRLRGGLGLATVGASALFGSVSGSAMASTSTMSVVAVPEMRKFGYDDGLAAATTAVGGTLGMLIPPSAVLVLYAILTEESIGRVLIGGIVPGAMTAALLMLTAWIIARVRPHLAPRNLERERPRILPAIARTWAGPVIFLLSMGGIYLGVFTPTEAGAAGAFIALAYSLLTRRLRWNGLLEALSQTVRVSAMIFLVIIGGKMFGFFLSASGIPRTLGETVAGLDIAPFLIILAIFAIYFALGAFMDEIAILVIMTPMMYPIILELGYDPIWFGVLSVMMLLTGLLTPPVGLVSFVVSGITGISIGKVFRGVAPFWIALTIAVLLTAAFPEIVLFLPSLMN